MNQQVVDGNTRITRDGIFYMTDVGAVKLRKRFMNQQVVADGSNRRLTEAAQEVDGPTSGGRWKLERGHRTNKRWIEGFVRG